MSNFEVERRFLVVDRRVTTGHVGNLLVQAYLFAVDGYAVRVRRTHWPNEGGGHREGPAFMTVKGPRVNAMREEYETEVSADLAAELIRRAPAKLSKTRYQIVAGGGAWDVDVFHGDNEGLMVAEYEGNDAHRLERPLWCGTEVTGDRRYDNENLAKHPFRAW